VLVVEDDPTIRDAIAGYLQDAEYIVDAAAHGAAALACMRVALPDLVLLDLRMPIMDGQAFLAACRAEPRFGSVPVILLSAAGDAQRVAARLDVDAVLLKPFDLEVLLALVQRATRAQPASN
jgi:CheY-like chemotaxis protein